MTTTFSPVQTMEQHREWIKNDNDAQRKHQDQNPGMYRRQWSVNKNQNADDTKPEQQKPPYQSTYVEQENYSFTGTPHSPELTKSYDGFTQNPKQSTTRELKPATYQAVYTAPFKRQTDNDPIIRSQPMMEGDYEFLHLSGSQNQYKELQRKANGITFNQNQRTLYQSEKPDPTCYEAAVSQIKPQTERMSFGNYTQTSIRPVGEIKIVKESQTAPRAVAPKEPSKIRYGTYRPKRDYPGRRTDNDTTPMYNRSYGSTDQGKDSPQYKTQCMKRTCMTSSFPNTESRSISADDLSGSNRNTNVKYQIRDFDGVTGVMDFGGAGGKGRRFVYKDPSLYVFNK